jgi:hypothetical protein
VAVSTIGFAKYRIHLNLFQAGCGIGDDGFMDEQFQNPTSDINNSKIFLINCPGSG